MAWIAGFLKRYYVPIALFALGLFFQLVVLPLSYPPLHYDALGLPRLATIQEVKEAYEKLQSQWDSGISNPTTADFVKIRYAFEILSNPLWKRDYDLFGIEEQLHVIESTISLYGGLSFTGIKLPLLEESSSNDSDYPFNSLTTEEFVSRIGSSKAMLVQVYSAGSSKCGKFLKSWKRIAYLLDGVADTAMVEVGEIELASHLAERSATNQPFFRYGLPSIIAFPPGCRSTKCFLRYVGDLSVEAIVDWLASDVLDLPRILYYSKETLGPNFIAKSGQHKVKVINFSKTGERAAPFLRQVAKDYWAYASFACVLWTEQDSSIWWNSFNVESAPALIFLRDPGEKAIVYHGSLNSSSFEEVFSQNKHFELPQLRSVSSMELGCDPRGYSRAGISALTWYCVILVGRPSLEMNKMRGIIRRAQRVLSNNDNSDVELNPVNTVPTHAAVALNEKRLTFAWLDGETQKDFCLFYLRADNIYETCGPRRDPTDVPRLFIVRYKRNSTLDHMEVKEKPRRRTIWDAYNEVDANQASQLVAKYNGSDDIQEIINWISTIVADGDSRELPHFVASTPDLIPEDSDPIWSRSARNIVTSGKGLSQKMKGFLANSSSRLRDPRLGPAFLLLACITFGAIWLKSSQESHAAQKNTTTSVNSTEKELGGDGLEREPLPSSITDVEPKDAQQWEHMETESE